MLLRLLIGIMKGLALGGLVGFALANMGFAAPGAPVAYLAAAVTGALVGLIAGKPIWASLNDSQARIEVGLKAVFGALLAMGLMWLTRSFVGIGIPFDLGAVAVANPSLQETAAHGTVGGLAITSLALVAAVLGGFYDADNTPEPKEEKKRVAAPAAPKADSRPKSSTEVADLDFDDEPAEQKKNQR